jgi:putative ABC transport system permease protein
VDRWLSTVDLILQDIRTALRSLTRTPGFTVVALLTLAIGIGSTTAIFSVVDGILLRPLPYPDPQAIVSVSRQSASGAAGSFSAADYLDYRSTKSFAAFAGYRQQIVDLTGPTEPLRLTAMETTSALFDVFGLPALIGRTYSEKTDAPTGPRIAVVAEKVWRQHLGADPGIAGRTVRLNGIPTTVLGVMPEAFVHPNEADLWMLAPQDVPTSPVPIEGNVAANREVQYFQGIARLQPNISIGQANNELGTISERLAREFPETNGGEGTIARSYQDTLVGDVRTALLVLLGAVGFVLLIACANVAGLLLARGAGRRRELAVRTALGAGRRRLVGQLLSESLVLAGVGGLVGLIFARWGVYGLIALAPENLPRLKDVRLDLRVAAFAVAVSAAVGVLFGIVPALQSTRLSLTDALKDGGRTGTSRTRTQKALVVAEVALALMLLIGAGLMITSFSRLRAVDPGFTVSQLMVVWVPLPQARYDNAAQARFYSELAQRLRDNPVTARSALAFPTPFGGGNAEGAYTAEGAPPQSRANRPVAEIGSISPGYFQTLGIPLLRGRDVALTDRREGAGVVVVNQALAEREWPNQDPIGKRLALGGDPTTDPNSWLTVVGVVANSKRSDLQAGPRPAVYFSVNAFTLPFMGALVRSEAGEAAVLAAVRGAAQTLDAELPVTEVETIDRILERVTGQPRFRATLIGAFAGAALLLAAVGLYGLISYSVAQRVPEIGVRLALGATPGQVGRLVLGQGLALAAGGVALGLAGALAAARLVEGLLFSISATDPTLYALLALLLLGIAALACYMPTRRAMRVQPMTALRAE